MKLLKHYGLALFAALFAFGYASAQSDAEPQTGSIKVGSLTSTVTLVNPNTGEVVESTAGTIFTAPTTVVTAGDASAVLVFSNGAVVEVLPGSRLEVNLFNQAPFDPSLGSFEGLEADPSVSQVSIRVVGGDIVVNVGKLHSGSAFVVETPTSTIDSSDAVFVVGVNQETAQTVIANISGEVSYETKGATESVSLPAGVAVEIPGQIDSTGNVTAGEPVVRPVTPEESQAGAKVQSPSVTQPGTTPAEPTTPPAGTSTTPNTDLSDLINPTSTAPRP